MVETWNQKSRWKKEIPQIRICVPQSVLSKDNSRRKQWAPVDSFSMRQPIATSLREDEWPRNVERLVREGYNQGDVVVVGIGHPLKSDDYVGSLIAKDLLRKSCDRDTVMIVDAENSPENILYAIWNKKTSILLLIDSVDAGLPLGSIRLVELSETSYPFFTGHNIPLRLMLQPGPEAPRAVLLGVQPGSLGVGGVLSREVEEARATIVRELCRIFRGLGDEPIGV